MTMRHSEARASDIVKYPGHPLHTSTGDESTCTGFIGLIHGICSLQANELYMPNTSTVVVRTILWTYFCLFLDPSSIPAGVRPGTWKKNHGRTVM